MANVRTMKGTGGSAAMALAPVAHDPAPPPPEVEEDHVIDSVELEEVAGVMIDLFIPAMIWGPPGIGKSEIVRRIVERRGNSKLVELRLPLLSDPSELRGLPLIVDAEKRKMAWAPTPEMEEVEAGAECDRVVLFLDEINGADPQVQAAAYQLILDRRVGTWRLPANVAIIAAGNRENDRGVTYRMAKPLANRMFHFHLGADYAAWRDWAIENGIHPQVLSYLAFSKSDLLVFDPSLPDKSFATPRMWERVSEILHCAGEGGISERASDTAVIAAIGQTTGAAFNAHRRYFGKLPAPDRILSGEVTGIEGVSEMSARYAITVSLATELAAMAAKRGRRADEADFRTAFENAMRFIMKNFVDKSDDGSGAEMAYLFIKVVTASNSEDSQKLFSGIFARIANDGRKGSPTVRFIERYSHLMEGM